MSEQEGKKDTSPIWYIIDPTDLGQARCSYCGQVDRARDLIYIEMHNGHRDLLAHPGKCISTERLTEMRHDEEIVKKRTPARIWHVTKPKLKLVKKKPIDFSLPKKPKKK